jgi:hypothetical protein
MLLTKISCDGCLRKPNFWEWVKGEMSSSGYEDWRHPGIPFKNAGCPLTYDNQKKAGRMFFQLFGRPLPDELSYFCPECQTRVELELPALAAVDPGDTLYTGPDADQTYFGR